MQVAGLARRASRAFRVSLSFTPLFPQEPHPSSSQSINFRTFCPQNLSLSGSGCSNVGLVMPTDRQCQWNPKSLMSFTASFCSAPDMGSGNPTDAAKEVYDKMLESIKIKRSAPPNAWLWSLIEKSKTRDDIKLLFDILQQLRIFRLSNLRIHENFNCNLCQEVTKACVRAGAVDFGKKVLWKHNIYGLTPTVGSANQLLSYAKVQKDVKLMEEIMSLLRQNDLSLQPATGDIVFSICNDVDNWGLISKYSTRFLKAGVKLRKTTFDIWMEFASRRGDVESLWKIEKLRSDTYKQHTVKSAFSCAKGFLLEGKPDSAATVIQIVNQSFPDTKKQDIIAELKKLASEWPIEVIKQQKHDDQKALVTSLKADIPALISKLSAMGVESNVNLEDLNKAEPLPC